MKVQFNEFTNVSQAHAQQELATPSCSINNDQEFITTNLSFKKKGGFLVTPLNQKGLRPCRKVIFKSRKKLSKDEEMLSRRLQREVKRLAQQPAFEAGVLESLFGLSGVNTASNEIALLADTARQVMEQGAVQCNDIKRYIFVGALAVSIHEIIHIFYLKKTSALTLIASVTVMMVVNPDFKIGSFFEDLQAKFSGRGNFEAGENVSVVSSLLSGILVPLVNLISVKEFFNSSLGQLERFKDSLDTVQVVNKAVKILTEALDKCNRRAGAIDTIWNSVSDVLTYFVNIAKWMYYDRTWANFPEFVKWTCDSSVDSWLQATYDFVNKFRTNSSASQISLYWQLNTLAEEGRKFLQHKPDASVSRIVLDRLRVIDALLEKMSATGIFSGGVRAEPTCVVLVGEPGQGKSSLIELLHTDVMRRILTDDDDKKAFEENPSAFLYVRQSENEYWEGYRPNHYTCVFDDLGQVRDTATRPDGEFMNIIRAVNSFPYNLHMAELSLKANTYFTSKFVIVTSNQEEFNQVESITCKEALDRRLEHKYRIELREGHPVQENPSGKLVRKLDPSLLKIPVIDPSQVVITRLGPKGKQREVTWEELVSSCVSRIRENEKRFVSGADILRQLVKYDGPLEDYVSKYNEFTSREKLVLDGNTVTGLKDDSLLKELEEVDVLFDSVEHGVEDLSDKMLFPSASIKSFKEKITAKCDVYSEFLSSVGEKLKEVKPYLLPSVLVGLPLVAGLIKVYSMCTSKKTTELKGDYSFEYNPRIVKNGSRFVRPEVLRGNFQAGNIDTFGRDFLKKLMYKNVYGMKVICRDEFISLGYVTFLKDNICIFPYHFISKIEVFMDRVDYDNISEPMFVEFTRSWGDMCSFVYTVDELKENAKASDARDIYMWRAPPTMRRHADIMSKIAPPSLTDELTGVVIPFPDIAKQCIWVNNGSYLKLNEPEVLSDADSERLFEPESLMGYVNIATKSGDCGLPVLGVNTRGSRFPFLGYHIGSGSGKVGMGCRFDINELRDMISSFDEVIEIVEPDLVEDLRPCAPNGFQSGYLIEKRYLGASQTKLCKSPLYNIWGSLNVKPAMLKPFWNNGERIDPYMVAVQAYKVDPVYIPNSMIAFAAMELSSDLEFNSKVACPYERKVFDFEEAVLGVDGDEYFTAISRSTSPGYPHVFELKEHGKYYWFGKDQDYDLSNNKVAALKEACARLEQSAANGKREFYVFLDNLKDELRPSEKVDVGKTRLFSACPLELLVLTRRYFHAFASWIARNKVLNGCAVGLNAYSADWHIAAEKLISFGSTDRIIAGDYSRFDASEVVPVLMAILDIINMWYDDGDRNKKIRTLLWQEVVYSRHLRDNYIYDWCGSLPSGHPLTTTINCLYNQLAFRMCWTLCLNENSLSFVPFSQVCYLLVMGDDNVCSVSAEYADYFNENTLPDLMSNFGLTYTKETKEQISGNQVGDNFRNLTEVEFLKRKWRYEPVLKRYVAPLRVDSIYKSVYWYKTSTDVNEAIANCLDSCARELSLHEPSVWNEHWPVLRNKAASLGVTSRFVSREQALFFAAESSYIA